MAHSLGEPEPNDLASRTCTFEPCLNLGTTLTWTDLNADRGHAS
jgi:hypothetical protein